ncbi:MAG: Crp/Fnr family transcriptional regulator [Wenzhouxiangella sp.]
MNQKPIPIGNGLLDSLSSESCSRLMQAGTWVDLSPDADFDCAESLRKCAYFPSSCVIEIIGELPDGSSTGLLLIGPQEFCGSSVFPAYFALALRAIIIVPGRALRIPEAALVAEFDQDESTRWALLRALHHAFEQAAETSACRSRFTIDQLLSRWLVMVVERGGIGKIKITQERLAQALGVRREGVSQAFGRLKAAGLIDCRRGKVSICKLDELRLLYCTEQASLGLSRQVALG